MTRKGNEDRGLFLRDGKWWIVYADEFGKLHREAVGPKSLAREVYTRRKAEVLERRFRPENIRRRAITVAAAVDDALERAAHRKSIREMTRHGKRWKKLFGAVPLRQLTWGMIDRVTAKRRTKGVSEQTIYHELSFLRRVFNLARVDGLVDTVPIRGLKAPKGHRVRYLSPDEEEALLDELAVRWHPLVVFAMHTGLRAGEQFELTWAQIDFRARLVDLPETKWDQPRKVPLNDCALEALHKMPRVLGVAQVFCNRLGTPLNYHNFYNRVFLPALRAAGVTDFRWHDLRHTFASRMVMEGVDLYTVKELLGHTSIQQTQKYAHLSPGHQTRAVAVLAKRPKKTKKRAKQ